ncbi:MAG: hypothetical protein ACO3BX_00635 [Candidatus Limnocylindrus sp.]
MTAIGRPLRGAQLVAPITQQRVPDGRFAAAARQRAAIRQAFQPLSHQSGTGSIRTSPRPLPGTARPRTAITAGALPRGRIGVSAWSSTQRSGLFGLQLAPVVTGGAVVFAALFVALILSLEVTTSSARIERLKNEQAKIVEQIRAGETEMSRVGREPAVRRRAFELGIGQLTNPLIVEER